jgi:sulfate adenylyltransferase subunit 1 (EFTu-like GTPase family)
MDGQKILIGRIEAGHLMKGEEIYLLPQKKKVLAKGIKKFLMDDVAEADFEESLGICLKGKHRVKRGQILAGDLSSVISDRIQANIFWMDHTFYRIGEPLLFRCVTQEVPCQIEKVFKKFDPASLELVEENALSIRGAEVAMIMIHLNDQVVVDPFSDIPEMGRFVLEKEGRPAAGGIIL